MKIHNQHSRPGSEALRLQTVSGICNRAQRFFLRAVKENHGGNLESHNFIFAVQLCCHSWTR